MTEVNLRAGLEICNRWPESGACRKKQAKAKCPASGGPCVSVRDKSGIPIAIMFALPIVFVKRDTVPQVNLG